MSDSSRNSLNVSPSTSSKVLPFYFTLNFDRCMSFHGKLFLRFFNPFAANKRAIYKKNIRKTLSPDSFEKKSIDQNRCRTSKVIHIQIRNNQERDSVSDFTLACDSRWHHFESTPHALLVQNENDKMKAFRSSFVKISAPRIFYQRPKKCWVSINTVCFWHK